MPSKSTPSAGGRLASGLAALIVVLALMAIVSSPASAAFGIADFGGLVAAQDGSSETAAGAHPYSATVDLQFATVPGPFGPQPDGGSVRNIEVELPPGFVGNPQALPQCTQQTIADPANNNQCPRSTQVGFLDPYFDGFSSGALAIYNMEPPPGVAAQFAFNLLSNLVFINGHVRSNGDYGLSVATESIPQTQNLTGMRATFWGVPADPSHDLERGGPSDAFPRAFLSNPGNCDAGALTTGARASSWPNPDSYASASFNQDLNGNPMKVEDCDRLSFEPEVGIEPTSSKPDSPSGLSVDLSFSQEGLENPTGLAPAHMKRATVTLPEGMTISPSAADGLQGCSNAQFDRTAEEPLRCPDASKIGTVSARSPLLAEELEGGVYLGSQQSNDPASGQMFRMFIRLANAERGIDIRLPGEIRVSPQTGRIETTFDNNPQLPVSELRLELDGGSRAPLATPQDCGTHTVETEMTSWAGHTVELTDSFTIDCPGAGGFAPAFKGGAVSPVGGAFSPFVVGIDRDDREQYVSGVRIELPKGLLAKLAGVPLCGSAAAAGGGCPVTSRVGTATVGAGPGSDPFYLQGPVYLTEGYKGAPYGLAVHVHVKAGPFDLGWVRVRQALYVDPETSQATVVSDLLPQIVKGVPVRMRSVDVAVDRPGFTVNPTSCAEKRVEATLTSIDGAVHRTGSRFQVGDCASLGFRPRLGMRLVGKGRMRSGGHPALRAVVTQGDGQANIKAAKVTLPPNVVLDSKNSVDPKLLCGYDASLKADCPASSIIGKASLRTPLLNKPLTGPVHFVQGIRFENGNRIRTLPTLLIKLRGEVSINLRSKTNTDSKDRLVSTFPNVPDARAGKFNLQINGGRKGILVVTENRRGRINLCNRKQTALVETDGHNGKRADYPVRVKTPCAKRRKR